MSGLKIKLERYDYIAPSKNVTQLHRVIKIDLHTIILLREEDDKLIEVKKRTLNMGMWIKVDPKTIKVLYEDL